MTNHINRTFIPGDNWVYFKIYTGYKTSEQILVEVLPLIIVDLQNDNILSKWFFLRYADPDSHLRIRFYLNDRAQFSTLLDRVNQALATYVEENLIWRVQIDTYQREIERYGRSSMELAESIFHFDSEAVMHILNLSDNNEAEHQRWLIALRMLDILLSDFKFDLDEKIVLLSTLSENFKKELGFTNKGYQLQLDRKYRMQRKLIEEIMSHPEKVSWAGSILEIIAHRSLKMQPVVMKLLRMKEAGQLEVELHNLLGSIIHMMINRLFRSKQRVYELVIYDMLERYYSSLSARKRREDPAKQQNHLAFHLKAPTN